MSYIHLVKDFRTIDLNAMRPHGFLDNILQRQRRHFEIVSDKNGWEEVTCCPLCGSQEHDTEFTKFNLELFKCKECTLRYFSKVPVNTEDVYSDENALEISAEAYLKNAQYRKERFAKERIELIKRCMSEQESFSILDVGCGTGWFLESAQEHGFQVAGLELGKDLAEFTANRLGITVWDCELEMLVTEQRFDVITMFDLIEHVKKPVNLIKAAKKLLKPNGIIVVFTPNFDSVAIQIMEEKSNLIMPAEHLTYFTKEAVDQLAKVTKTLLIYYETKGIDLGDLKSFYEFQDEVSLAEACEKLFNIIQPTIDKAGTGNHMRFILQNT